MTDRTVFDDQEVAKIQMALGMTARRAKDLRLQEAVGERAGYSLEGPLFSTLSSLGRDDWCTVSELAERCGMELSTVSRRVRTLRERGLVRYRTSATDRRVVHLQLTDEGRDQFEALSVTWRTMLNDTLSDWAPEEVEQFAELFTKFASDLEAFSIETLGLRPLNAWPTSFDGAKARSESP